VLRITAKKSKIKKYIFGTMKKNLETNFFNPIPPRTRVLERRETRRSQGAT